MDKRSKKYLFLLIFLHFAIALPLAFVLNIWIDEASTLHSTGDGLLAALQTAAANEKQAPLYFWILSVWRSLDHSIFFARIFSLLCGLLAIRFFDDLARRIFEGKAAVRATAFFALHPFLFWASLEIRVYALVILLSVLLLKFFFDGFLGGEELSGETVERSKRARFLYLFCAVVALYTNYYLGFLLAANFAALVVTRKWKAAGSYALRMVIVGLACAPLVRIIADQFGEVGAAFRGTMTISQGLQFLSNYLLTFYFPTEIFPPEGRTTAVSVFRLWLGRAAILAAVLLLVADRRRIDRKTIVCGTIAAVVGAFMLLAYFLLGEVYVMIRHAAVLFAPLILFGGLVLVQIFPAVEEKNAGTAGTASVWTWSAALMTAVFFTYALIALYPHAAKNGDWARVGEFIRQNETAGQPIVIANSFDALALPYHYSGSNAILPDERFFVYEQGGVGGNAEVRRREIEFIISEIPREAREIWLLTKEKCGPASACAPLENFVEANYTVIEEKDFYKIKVRLLRKK